MKRWPFAYVAILACGTSAHDPQVSTDPCNGQCSADQVCNVQTGGVVEAGTYENCVSWPTTCGHDCDCLIKTFGFCPGTQCGIGPNGTYVYHCIGD